MKIEEAEVYLHLRKYQWAMVSIAQEVEAGFSFLRTLSDTSVQKFLVFIDQFSTAEQLEIAATITRSCYRPAIQLLGEAFTQEDDAKIRSYYARLRSISLPVNSSSPIGETFPVTKTFAVKRAGTAKIALSSLSSAFGTKPEKFASLQWFYVVSLGDWQFRTDLDFSGTWGTEIRCVHRLIRNDSKSWGFLMMPLTSKVGLIRVSQSFTLPLLYGIPSGIYYINTTDDIEIATHTILSAYNRLSQAIPGWVDNLTIG